ncbi:GNAT family N-acetyltransferase [Tellurirhabdus rosea]|uniref:GNAT family N-acetyltransferase n=1 Tax=Tellurirhabdus rosea TaxID=2674997 RepID=UPI0022598F4F|nr:GNAT family N-acetyltransferase [Tellurirhabdus rosea]
MKFVRIEAGNLHLIRRFLERLGRGEQTFRYFQKRPVETVLHHTYCAVLMDGAEPAAYGHLDPEADTLWLGLAVAEACQGRGLGRQMLAHLLQTAADRKEKQITLSVDKQNQPAIALYESAGFRPVRFNESTITYTLNL